ncbi:hypothetical protein BESB_006580 [Besnoitia besnoiti]|uniref:ARID domain-containing protein n=1 Tax=Besnoitia besnoiti TaxID=94643 RepID=A0A2A9MQ72_BESBE|nr:hypothetical protein BESB_006580 [Besnoitia besnoiti]PFH38317.1 hypothetical protein BESB_006580 [Besnoitia besnoiti]
MDREQFLASLEKYHLERGHPYVPGRLLGQKVDLYEMFMAAMRQGGFPRINKNNKWGYLAKHLRLVPKDKPPSAQDLEQVKRYYVKWIRHFEGERVPQHIKKDLIPPGMELPCKRSSSSSSAHSSSHGLGPSPGARAPGGAVPGALGAVGVPGISQTPGLFFDPQNPLSAFSNSALHPSQKAFPFPLGFGGNAGVAPSSYFGVGGGPAGAAWAGGASAAPTGAETQQLVGLQPQGMLLPGTPFFPGSSPFHDEQLLALGTAGPRTRNERRLAQQFGGAGAAGAGAPGSLGPGGTVLEMSRKRSKFFLKYSPEAVAERRWKRRRREALIAQGVLPPAVDVFRLQQCLEERRFAPADFVFALNVLYHLSQPDRGISVQQHPGLIDQLSGILSEAALSARETLLRRLHPSSGSPDLPAFFLSLFDADGSPSSRLSLLHDPLRPADLLPPFPFASDAVDAAPCPPGWKDADATLHVVALVAAILSNILFETGNVNFLGGVSRQCLLDASVAAGLQIAPEAGEGDGARSNFKNDSSFWEEACLAARGASLLRTGGPAAATGVVCPGLGGRGFGLAGAGGRGLLTPAGSPGAGGSSVGPGETVVSPDGLIIACGGGNDADEEETKLAALREEERKKNLEAASGAYGEDDEDREDEGSEAEAIELEEEILLGLSDKADIAFTRQGRMFRRFPSSSASGESSSASGSLGGSGLLGASGLGAGSAVGGSGVVSSSGALGSSGLLLSLSGSGGSGSNGDGSGASGGTKTREQERLAAMVRERTLKGLSSSLLSALDCCAISAYEGERYISSVSTETAMRVLEAFLVRERKKKFKLVCSPTSAAGGAASQASLYAAEKESESERDTEKAAEQSVEMTDEDREQPTCKEGGTQEEGGARQHGEGHQTQGKEGEVERRASAEKAPLPNSRRLLLSNAKKAVAALADALAAVGAERRNAVREEGEERKEKEEEVERQVCGLLTAAAKGDVAGLLHLLIQEQLCLVGHEENRLASFFADLEGGEGTEPQGASQTRPALSLGLLAGYGAARRAVDIQAAAKEAGLMREALRQSDCESEREARGSEAVAAAVALRRETSEGGETTGEERKETQVRPVEETRSQAHESLSTEAALAETMGLDLRFPALGSCASSSAEAADSEMHPSLPSSPDDSHATGSSSSTSASPPCSQACNGEKDLTAHELHRGDGECDRASSASALSSEATGGTPAVNDEAGSAGRCGESASAAYPCPLPATASPLVHTGRAVEAALCAGEMSEAQNLLFGRPVSISAARQASSAVPLFSATVLRPRVKGEREAEGAPDRRSPSASGFSPSSFCGCAPAPGAQRQDAAEGGRDSEARGAARNRKREEGGKAGEPEKKVDEQDARRGEDDEVFAAAVRTPLLLGHLDAEKAEFAFDFAAFLSPLASRAEAANLLHSLSLAAAAASPSPSPASQDLFLQQFSDLGVLFSKSAACPIFALKKDDRSKGPNVSSKAVSHLKKKGKACVLVGAEKQSAFSVESFLRLEMRNVLHALHCVAERAAASREQRLNFYRHVSRIFQSLLFSASSSLGQAPLTWQRPHGLAAFLLALQLLILSDPQRLGKALGPIYARVVAASSLLLPQPPAEKGKRLPALAQGSSGLSCRADEEREKDRSGGRRRAEPDKVCSEMDAEGEEAETAKEADEQKEARSPAHKKRETEDDSWGAASAGSSPAEKTKRAAEEEKEEEEEDWELNTAERVRLIGWEKLKKMLDGLSPQLETAIACVKAFTALVSLLPAPPSPSLFSSSSALLYRDAPQSSWLALSFVSSVARLFRGLQEISHTRIPRVLQCAAGLHFLQAASEFASQMLLFRQTAIYAHLEIFLAVAAAILDLEVSVPSLQLPRVLTKAGLAVMYLAVDGPAEALCEVLECAAADLAGKRDDDVALSPVSLSREARRRRRRPSPAAVEAAARLFLTPLLRFLKFRLQRAVRIQSQSELADPLAPCTAMYETEANRRLVSAACASPFATVIPQSFVSSASSGSAKGGVSLDKSRGGWSYSHFIGAVDEIPEEVVTWKEKAAPPKSASSPASKGAEALLPDAKGLSPSLSRSACGQTRAERSGQFSAPSNSLQKRSNQPERRLRGGPSASLAPDAAEAPEGRKTGAGGGGRGAHGDGEEALAVEEYRRSAAAIAECFFPEFFPQDEPEPSATQKAQTDGREAAKARGRQAEGREPNSESGLPASAKDGDSSTVAERRVHQRARPNGTGVFDGEGAGVERKMDSEADIVGAHAAETPRAKAEEFASVSSPSSLVRGDSHEREDDASPTSSLRSAAERKGDDDQGSDVDMGEGDREAGAGPVPVFGQEETHGAPLPSQNRQENEQERSGGSSASFYSSSGGYYPGNPGQQGEHGSASSSSYYQQSSFSPSFSSSTPQPHAPANSSGVWQQSGSVSMPGVGGGAHQGHMYPSSSYSPPNAFSSSPHGNVPNRGDQQGQWMAMHHQQPPQQQHYSSSPYYADNYYGSSSSSSWRQQQWLQWQHEQQRAVARQVCGGAGGPPAGSAGAGDPAFGSFPSSYPQASASSSYPHSSAHMLPPNQQQPAAQQWGGNMYGGGGPWPQGGGAGSGQQRDGQFFMDGSSGAEGAGATNVHQMPGASPQQPSGSHASGAPGRAGAKEGDEAQGGRWMNFPPHMQQGGSQENMGLMGGRCSADGLPSEAQYGVQKEGAHDPSGRPFGVPPSAQPRPSSHNVPYPGDARRNGTASANLYATEMAADVSSADSVKGSSAPPQPGLQMPSAPHTERMAPHMNSQYGPPSFMSAPGGASGMGASMPPRGGAAGSVFHPCSAPFGSPHDRTGVRPVAEVYPGMSPAPHSGENPAQGNYPHFYSVYGSSHPLAAQGGDLMHALHRGDASGAKPHRPGAPGARGAGDSKDPVAPERDERDEEGGNGAPGSALEGAGADGESAHAAAKGSGRAASPASGGVSAKKKCVKKEDSRGGAADGGIGAAAIAAAIAFGDEEAKVDDDVLVGVSVLLLLASNSLTLPLLRPHLPAITELAWFKTTASGALFSVIQEMLSSFRDAPPVHLRGFRDGAAYFPSSRVKEERDESDAKASEEREQDEDRERRISDEFAKLGDSRDLLLVRKVGEAGKVLRVPETVEMRGG